MHSSILERKQTIKNVNRDTPKGNRKNIENTKILDNSQKHINIGII